MMWLISLAAAEDFRSYAAESSRLYEDSDGNARIVWFTVDGERWRHIELDAFGTRWLEGAVDDGLRTDTTWIDGKRHAPWPTHFMPSRLDVGSEFNRAGRSCRVARETTYCEEGRQFVCDGKPTITFCPGLGEVSRAGWTTLGIWTREGSHHSSNTPEHPIDPGLVGVWKHDGSNERLHLRLDGTAIVRTTTVTSHPYRWGVEDGVVRFTLAPPGPAPVAPSVRFRDRKDLEPEVARRWNAERERERRIRQCRWLDLDPETITAGPVDYSEDPRLATFNTELADLVELVEADARDSGGCGGVYPYAGPPRPQPWTLFPEPWPSIARARDRRADLAKRYPDIDLPKIPVPRRCIPGSVGTEATSDWLRIVSDGSGVQARYQTLFGEFSTNADGVGEIPGNRIDLEEVVPDRPLYQTETFDLPHIHTSVEWDLGTPVRPPLRINPVNVANNTLDGYTRIE